MPVYFEIALAEQDGFNNLYQKDTLSWKDGLQHLATDTVFDPIYFYNGESSGATKLGHVKMGVNTPYVNYVTGFKYAKLPPHTNVNWTTVDKEWDAGYNEVGGYSQFDLAPALKTLLSDTGVEANVVLAPNRTANRAGGQYGFYGYANAKFNIGDYSQYVDTQYNGAYGTAWNAVFDNVMEHDFIVGYQGAFGPLTAKANFLANKYGSYTVGKYKTLYAPSSSDVGTVNDAVDNPIDNMAGNINFTYSTDRKSTRLNSSHQIIS